MENTAVKLAMTLNRRVFLKAGLFSAGSAALSALESNIYSSPNSRLPHFTPKAKRIIYLHQSGAPSQLELFDYKPKLMEMFGEELPDSVRRGQRVTGMTSDQRSFPLALADFNFRQYGESQAWVSDLLPYHQKMVDQLCFIKSMHTEAINHDPAITFIQTGSQQAGRPSFGSWLSYGLGNENDNLPSFVVLLSRSNHYDQPLYAKLWGSDFYPLTTKG